MRRTPSPGAGWQWQPAAVSLCGLALLAGFAFRGLLAPGVDVIPGRDASNLYIWELFTRSTLAAGQLPYWNPFHFAGTPHLADPQTTVWYPPALLLRWLPPATFLQWMALLHVWLSGAGGLFLGRVAGLGWIASAAVAVAMMLGGSVSPWLHNGHLLLLYCATWLPWALAFAMISARRSTIWPHPMLVVVLVLQFLAGYIQGSLYLVASVCLYFVFAALWPDPAAQARVARWRPVVQLAIAGVLALGVAAFQLLPTARLVGQAGRGAGITFADALQGSWSLWHLPTVFFPFYGAPSTIAHRDLSDAIFYVGWLMTAMVPFAFLSPGRRRLAVFLGILAVAAIVLASPELGLYRLHYALFPGLRVPGRILFPATLALALLGGLGLERFIALAASRQWRLLVPAAVGVAIVAVFAAIVTWPGGSAANMTSPGWPWLPCVAVGGLILVGVLATRDRARAAVVAGVVLVALDLTTFSTGAVALVPVEPEAIVKQWLGPAQAGRAISMCENRIGPGEMLTNGQAALDGPAAIILDDYTDWAYVARFGDPVPEDGIFHGMDSEGPLPARRDLVDLANVSVLVSCRPLSAPNLTLLSQHDDVYVYRNDTGWPRAFWTCGGEMLSEAAATERLVRARYTRDGRLLPEAYVNVRWALGIDARQREDLEVRHRLGAGVALDAETSRYVLEDPSADNVIALIQDPAVEDTHGVDRGTGAVMPPSQLVSSAADAGDELLTGTTACASRGTVNVLVQDQPDGRLVADVDAPDAGFVFLSEPHYAERKAFVDEMPAASVTADLAFTAVPVAAGHHRLELRYVPRSFHLGLAITGVTLFAWAGVPLLGRMRRRPTPERF